MSKRLWLGCLILCMPASIAKAQGKDQRPARPLEHLTATVSTFESKALGRKVSFSVFVPKSQDPKSTKTYPWILYLHGMWEDHARFAVRGGSAILDRMIGDKTLPELVFVCADGARDSFYVNGKKSGRYEDMLVTDLLPHIHEHYPVDKTRQRRALLGVSMGGFGALKIALRHPRQFGAVATHSAALLPRDPKHLTTAFPWLRGRGDQLTAKIFGKPVDLPMWQAESPLCLAETLEVDKLDGLKIYFDCGTKDRYGFHGPNVELHELLTKRKVPHVWRTVTGGDHGWRSGYNGKQLPESLRFIAQCWATDQGTRALGGLMGGLGKPAATDKKDPSANTDPPDQPGPDQPKDRKTP